MLEVDFGNDGIKLNAKLFKDGNQWCVLWGDNIQEGICGFGLSIVNAITEFRTAFRNS